MAASCAADRGRHWSRRDLGTTGDRKELKRLREENADLPKGGRYLEFRPGGGRLVLAASRRSASAALGAGKRFKSMQRLARDVRRSTAELEARKPLGGENAEFLRSDAPDSDFAESASFLRA